MEMRGKSAAPISAPNLGNQLAPRLCTGSCGRPATKASGYKWCYWCDPAIPNEEKQAARQLGGRRGQMAPAEVARLFDQLDPNSAESRTALRVRLMELLSVGRLTGSMYRDLLAGLDGMGKDQERTPKSMPRSVLVEVQKFGEPPSNGAGKDGE